MLRLQDLNAALYLLSDITTCCLLFWVSVFDYEPFQGSEPTHFTPEEWALAKASNPHSNKIVLLLLFIPMKLCSCTNIGPAIIQRPSFFSLLETVERCRGILRSGWLKVTVMSLLWVIFFFPGVLISLMGFPGDNWHSWASNNSPSKIWLIISLYVVIFLGF